MFRFDTFATRPHCASGIILPRLRTDAGNRGEGGRDDTVRDDGDDDGEKDDDRGRDERGEPFDACVEFLAVAVCGFLERLGKVPGFFADSDAPAAPGSSAFATTDGSLDVMFFLHRKSDRAQVMIMTLAIRFCALRAESADEPLYEKHADRRRDEERLDVHVEQARQARARGFL